MTTLADSNHDIDVLVLGAGMAGLTAARALAERGLRVTVLEARDRVGGRIFSQATGEGAVVEHGAEFVHGHAPELWSLIAESGVSTTDREGAMLREEPGSGLSEDNDDGSMFAPLEQLETYEGEDIPFAQWLAGSDVSEHERAALTGYVEGFNAADSRRISIRALGVQQAAEESIGGAGSSHIRGGYAQLAEYLAARARELGIEVRLRSAISTLRWRAGDVEVQAKDKTFRAAKCVITLPLGLLHTVNTAGVLQMHPEPAALAPARSMAMGQVARFTLLFRDRWWQASPVAPRKALETMSFVLTPGRMPPVWWTRHPEREPLPALTGWVGGPRAKALQGKSADELGREACLTLSEVFGVGQDMVQSSLLATYTHDWSADPFSLGAYSYVPVGALGASAAMAQPEADTLFFAGEHTDITGHWGTVHAAIRSGLRAAAQVLHEG